VYQHLRYVSPASQGTTRYGVALISQFELKRHTGVDAVHHTRGVELALHPLQGGGEKRVWIDNYPVSMKS
jgi:hypothetical protein